MTESAKTNKRSIGVEVAGIISAGIAVVCCANILWRAVTRPDPATELSDVAAPIINRAEKLGFVEVDTFGSDVTAAAIAQPGTALAIVFKRADGSYEQIPLTAEQINLGAAHDAIVFDLAEKQAALMPNRPPVNLPESEIPVVEIENAPAAP